MDRGRTIIDGASAGHDGVLAGPAGPASTHVTTDANIRASDSSFARPSLRFITLLAVMMSCLVIITIWVFSREDIALAWEATELDLVIHAMAFLSAGCVAGLAWVRASESGAVYARYQSGAFLVLSISSGLTVVAVLSGTGTQLGYMVTDPGQAPLYISMFNRALAAVLLVLAGLAPMHASLTPRHRWIVPLVPALLVVLVAVMVLHLGPRLPPLIGPDSLAELTRSTAVLDPGTLIPAMLAVQAVIGTLFVVAALLHGRLYLTEGSPPHAFTAMALLVAAFSQLHAAVVPGAYVGLVTSGDVLRVLFYAILLLGVAIGVRHDLRSLHAAQEQLVLTHEEEVRDAALRERTRLARDLHDGVVQDLWLVRLRQSQAIAAGGVTGSSERLLSQAASALDDAIADARQAVVAVGSAIEGAAFGSVVKRVALDFGERFGLPVDVRVDERLDGLPSRAEGEVLRIMREALSNAWKHGDPGLVQVILRGDDREVTLEVSDNGRGFAPGRNGSGYGLHSMGQRAALIGADLEVRSGPGDGTAVRLRVPRAAVGAP
jgi:signal transduction histidine kinase